MPNSHDNRMAVTAIISTKSLKMGCVACCIWALEPIFSVYFPFINRGGDGRVGSENLHG